MWAELEAVSDHHEAGDCRDELLTVFQLCDRQSKGYLEIESFCELSKQFFGESVDMSMIIDYFDPKRRGIITFEDFCRGANTLIHQRNNNNDEHNTASARTDSSKCPIESSSATSNADQSSLSSSSLRAQSPTDSGLDDRNEERFECDYDEDLNGNKRVNDSLRSQDSYCEESPNIHRFANRNTWSRTSVRRNSCSAKSLGTSFGKDLSAASVANASLNQALSRRSSFSFGADENDFSASFADQSQVVDDLTDKVQVMEMQMSALSDDLSLNKDLYHRVRQENSSLTERIHSLEESLRELEVKSDQQLKEERRQFTQMIERKDRERSLEVDQHVNKLMELQNEHLATKEELIKARSQNEQLKLEKKMVADQYADAQLELQTIKQDHRAIQEVSRKEREEYLREKQMSQQIVQELTQRIEELQDSRKNSIQESLSMRHRSPSFIQSLPLYDESIEHELERLRLDNRRLKEKNEELEEELMELKVGRGQRLLQGGDANSQDNNWAAETNNLAMLSKEELLGQLIKLKETNVDLREYIGTVLSNIIMTNPQVLERKS